MPWRGIQKQPSKHQYIVHTHDLMIRIQCSFPGFSTPPLEQVIRAQECTQEKFGLLWRIWLLIATQSQNQLRLELAFVFVSRAGAGLLQTAKALQVATYQPSEGTHLTKSTIH
jgi:hypothetical protein